MSRARYYISFDNSTWTEFYPTNQPKISYVREANEIFYRYKIDKFKIGRTKNESVYDDLYQRFFDYLYFGTDVYYKVNVLGTDKFYFIDPITSGRINTQDCFYEATPDTNDTYRDIFLEYNKEWDNADGKLFLYETAPYYPVINNGGFDNVDFDPTWSGVYPSISYVHDGDPIGERYAKLDMSTIPNGTVVTVIIKNYTKTGANDPTLVLADSAAGTERSNKVTVTADGRYELLKNAAGACVLEFAVVNTTGVSHSGSLDIYVYEPTVPAVAAGTNLHDVIERCLSHASYMNLTAFSGNVVSTALWNDAFPTGHATATPNVSAYITANPTYDYVIEAAAIYNDLYLGRTDAWTTTREENVPVSLKDIMDILKVFRYWWFIDPDGKFRIEHEKYFRDFIVQADLTSATYTGDKPEVDVKFYRYEKTDVYSQVTYSGTNDTNEDWVTFSRIDYGTKYTGININDVSTTVTTDLKYVIDNPTDATSSGLILIRVDGNDCIPWDLSEITAGEYYPNQKLSWAFLTDNYMNYFAEALTGENANGSHTFTHVKEFLKQDNIKFRLTTDLDWKKPFTLAEGTGWFEGGEYEPETGMYKINVGYNPYAIQIYVVDSTDSTIGIVDDDGTTDIIL